VANCLPRALGKQVATCLPRALGHQVATCSPRALGHQVATCLPRALRYLIAKSSQVPDCQELSGTCLLRALQKKMALLAKSSPTAGGYLLAKSS
jgi:hypothetical protein